MKFFINTANLDQIRDVRERGVLDVVSCAKLGADVEGGFLSSVDGLLNPPLSDSGLKNP